MPEDRDRAAAARPQALIAGAIAASAALLFWDLDRHSFWIDELATWEAMEGSFRDVIAWCVRDVHPPLYYLSLKVWVELAGKSDFTLRSFSALAALFASILVGPVARRWIQPSAAVPATFLLALHPALVELGRMARYYSLLVLLSLASLLALHAARERGRFRDWALYALSITAAVHVFYPTAFLTIAHVPLVAGSPRPRAGRGFVLAVAAVAVLSLPWVGRVGLDHVRAVSGGIPVELTGSWTGFVLGIAASFYTFSVGQMLYPWNAAAWCGLLAIGGLLAAALLRSGRADRWRLAAALVLSISVVALLMNFLVIRAPFLHVPIRGLFALPFLVLLLAHGVERLTSRHVRWAGIILLAIAWTNAHASYFSVREYLNPIHYTPSKEAVHLIHAAAEPGDAVISTEDIGIAHYLRTDELDLEHVLAEDEAALAALLATRPRRVWLVTLGRDRTRHNFGAAAERARQELEKAYARTLVKRLRPIDPLYLGLKERLLRRRSYRYRLTVELFVARS